MEQVNTQDKRFGGLTPKKYVEYIVEKHKEAKGLEPRFKAAVAEYRKQGNTFGSNEVNMVNNFYKFLKQLEEMKNDVLQHLNQDPNLATYKPKYEFSTNDVETSIKNVKDAIDNIEKEYPYLKQSEPGSNG